MFTVIPPPEKLMALLAFAFKEGVRVMVVDTEKARLNRVVRPGMKNTTSRPRSRGRAGLNDGSSRRGSIGWGRHWKRIVHRS